MPQQRQRAEPLPKSTAELAPPATKGRRVLRLETNLLLAGGMCVLPFLLPYNQLFEAEWLAAALGVTAALFMLAGPGTSLVSLPTPARWLVAFALFLGAQTAMVHPIYPQVPVLAALYALFAALLVWLGAQLSASSGFERAANVLAPCLLAGALANAAAAAIQVYGFAGPLQDVVAYLPYSAGAYGNIGQANLFANYLALGGSALLFMWWRGRVRTGYALAAAVLLAWACALSGARTSLLYALWFALLGMVAGRVQSGIGGRRLRSAACTFAALMLAANVVIPWFNAALGLGNAAKGAIERVLPALLENAEPRWQIWLLAWRVFADAPLAGAGIGGFAGAAFRAGLSPSLTQFGNQVWTSPHNLPLQLLAETGALGAFLALAGVCAWCWQAGQRYFTAREPAMWWLIAAVGIELIHSMFEYPLWSAHFLGLTALLMGLGTRPGASSPVGSRLIRTAIAGTCAVLALATAMLLRDYVRFNATRVTGTTITLAGPADAARDAAMMRELTDGLLAPPAEYWIVLGAALDRSQLADRLAMSERVAHHYPAHAIIVRRAVFLAFAGQAEEARRVLAQAIYTFPKRCGETIRILAQALDADAGAIRPLLVLAQEKTRPDCAMANFGDDDSVRP